MMVEERKNGRIIDSIFPYNMYEGQFYVRSEIVENAPDVVQAFSDAFAEATLWIRLNPEKAARPDGRGPEPEEFLQGDPAAADPRLQQPLQADAHLPARGSSGGGERDHLQVAATGRSRITRPLAAKDFADAVDARYMDRTFAKLGWAVPKQPPFLPAGWKGDPGKPPFPEYMHAINTKTPQAFPEKGDLVKAWSFGGKSFAP